VTLGEFSRRSALRLAVAAGFAGVGTGVGERAATVSAAGLDPTQVAKLAAADGDADDNFSYSMAVSSDGTTALVGAESDEDPSGFEAGSAYVFDLRSGSDPSPPAGRLSWGDRPATDPDDDGVYEDIKGDGEYTILDVSDYLDDYEGSTVQSNATKCDFNDDDGVTVLDIAELLDEL
jgi:hypothetical protein